jgi:hypothetical protein
MFSVVLINPSIVADRVAPAYREVQYFRHFSAPKEHVVELWIHNVYEMLSRANLNVENMVEATEEGRAMEFYDT